MVSAERAASVGSGPDANSAAESEAPRGGHVACLAAHRAFFSPAAVALEVKANAAAQATHWGWLRCCGLAGRCRPVRVPPSRTRRCRPTGGGPPAAARPATHPPAHRRLRQFAHARSLPSVMPSSALVSQIELCFLTLSRQEPRDEVLKHTVVLVGLACMQLHVQWHGGMDVSRASSTAGI